MKIDLITRSQLEVINKRGLRYPLADAEKDYFLAIILKIIYNSFLGELLVFKGGTAIYHCYLEQFRFSKDLDFTALQPIDPIKINEIFEEHEFLKVKNLKKKKYGLDFSLQYQGMLLHPNSIDIDINKNQKVLLKINHHPYSNNYGINVQVTLMNIKEIVAEKIRTLNERPRARDLYDIYLIRDAYKICLREAVDLLKQKELSRPLSKKNIKENVKIALDSYKSDLENLSYRKFVPQENINNLIKELIAEI